MKVCKLDSRLYDFAKLIVHTSTKVKRGDNVIIQIIDEGQDLATEIYKEVVHVGGHPLKFIGTELVQK